MRFIRHVVVFDAADVAAESAFWAELLDGQVVDDEDERFHCVVDASGQWRIGVQHAPDHTPPEWPDGNPQQQGKPRPPDIRPKCLTFRHE